MAIYDKIIELDVKDKYKTEILGFGEIYEIISVNRLKRKFKEGRLFLATNKAHLGQGYTLAELNEKVNEKGWRIIASGFVDCPPWPSKPRTSDNKRKMSHAVINGVVAFIIRLLVFLERIWKNEKRAHMVYVLALK